MKINKKIALLAVTTNFIISSFLVVPVLAGNNLTTTEISTLEKNDIKNDVEKYIENFIKDAYNKYYKLDDFSFEIISQDIQNDEVTIEINTIFQKTLKANKSDETPYIKALKEEKKNYKNDNLEIEAYDEYVIEKESDVESFINVKQDASATFKISSDYLNKKLDLKNAILEVRYGLEYLPSEYFLLDSEEDMIKSAKDDIKKEVKYNKEKKLKEKDKSLSLQIVSYYDRFKAIEYSNRWALSFNPSYNNMNPYGGDCANFVSQCIFAGGIPTDSVWKPYTTAWANTGFSSSYYGLFEYMTAKGYFREVGKYQAAGGGFMLFPHSHIVFINKNDTVSMTYNGHNYNEKDVSFASSKFSNANGYRFFF